MSLADHHTAADGAVALRRQRRPSSSRRRVPGGARRSRPSSTRSALGIVVANAAANYNATSTTSLAIGTGSKSLTVDTGKLYAVGQFVIAAALSGPTNYMSGQVTAYNADRRSDHQRDVDRRLRHENRLERQRSASSRRYRAFRRRGHVRELAGGTMTGRSSRCLGVGGAGFNVPPGAAPTSPANGDVWTTARAFSRASPG
jgi:hypothetical protein